MLHQDSTRNTTLSPTDSDERRKRRVSWTERLTVVWVELKDKLPSRSSSPTPSHDTEVRGPLDDFLPPSDTEIITSTVSKPVLAGLR